MGANCCGSKGAKATTIEIEGEDVRLERKKKAQSNPKMMSSNYYNGSDVKHKPANYTPLRAPK